MNFPDISFDSSKDNYPFKNCSNRTFGVVLTCVIMAITTLAITITIKRSIKKLDLFKGGEKEKQRVAAAFGASFFI